MKDFHGNEAINLPEVGEEEVWKVIKDFPKYEVSSLEMSDTQERKQ